MEKRLFIAIITTFAFLFAWSRLAPKLFPELARPTAKVESSAPAAPGASTPRPATTAAANSVIESQPQLPAAPVDVLPRTVTIDRPTFRAVLSNHGAQMLSFVLKGYKEQNGSPVDLVKRRSDSRNDFPFALVSGDAAWNRDVNARYYAVDEEDHGPEHQVRFRSNDRYGKSIVKTFSFQDDYLFHFSSQLANGAFPYRVEFGPGLRSVDPATKESQFTTSGNGVVQRSDSVDVLQREKSKGFHDLGPADFVGVEDNYFLTAVRPQKGGDAVLRVADFPAVAKGEKSSPEFYAGVNAAGGAVAAEVFFGPKQADVLDRFGFQRVIHFGTFSVIARVLLKALVYIFGFTHNYGWAIVLLTILIKLLLYPLQHKSIVSMKKMQRVQPKMNAIKEKYRKAKTDPDQRNKMNAEMMKLYSTEGISPVSGCLPILLQLPILWAFYGLLSNAIELRGAPWILWIHDLSAKDPYYITPILMTITMFIQQWITPSTVDPVQKRVFMMMPLIFGFIFKEFPSGLVLYWLVQNVLTIVQQSIMNRYWHDHPESLSPKPVVLPRKG